MSDNDTKTPWGDLARLEGNNFSLLSESRNGDFWERVATVGVGSFPGTLSYGQRNALELEHYNALLAKGRKSGLTRLLRLQELCAPESIIKHTRSGLSKYYTKAYKVHCRDKARHLSGWYKHDLRRRLYNVGNWIKAWGQDTMDRELQEIEAIRKYVATLRELGLGEHDGPEPGSITDPYGDSEEPVSIYWALERIEDYATEEKLAEYKAHITFGEGLLFLVSVSRPEGNDPGDDWLVLENLRSAVLCLATFRSFYIKDGHDVPPQWDIESIWWRDLDPSEWKNPDTLRHLMDEIIEDTKAREIHEAKWKAEWAAKEAKKEVTT